MAIEPEPSLHNLDETSQNEAWIEKNLKLLNSASPDELITYSESHFGKMHRAMAVQACEMQIDLYKVINRGKTEEQLQENNRTVATEDAYIAALPTLWRLHDEATSQ